MGHENDPQKRYMEKYVRPGLPRSYPHEAVLRRDRDTLRAAEANEVTLAVMAYSPYVLQTVQ